MNKQEIKRIAENARPNLDSYRNCGAINRQIATALEKEGLTIERVEGTLTEYGMRGHGPEHTFILIHTTGQSKQPIIVDGALNQFCNENKEKGLVFFTLGPKNQIKDVEVLVPSDKLYDAYTW